jgi:hypothetical protein
MSHNRRLALGLALSVCFIVVAGCGKKKGQVVKGNIVLPANASVKPDDSITLALIADAAGGGKSAGAAPISTEDLSFTIKGPGGIGVAPGKYTITLNFTPYPGGSADVKKHMEDLNKKFGDAKVSKLTYTVTDDPDQSITVDLDKQTVTKN